MPIYSRRFTLWTRLYNRLLLEPTGGDRVTPMVSEVVVPVLNADKILETPAAAAQAGDLTGSGFVTYWTVPEDEEWGLIQAFTDATTAATRFAIYFGSTFVNVTTSSTAAQDVNLRDWVLRVGDQIGMVATGNAADSSRYITLVYTVTDLSL